VRDSGISREEIYVTPKLPAEAKDYDSALEEFETTMGEIGLDYLDLSGLFVPTRQRSVVTFGITPFATVHQRPHAQRVRQTRPSRTFAGSTSPTSKPSGLGRHSEHRPQQPVRLRHHASARRCETKLISPSSERVHQIGRRP
jgi:hypothetical protein